MINIFLLPIMEITAKNKRRQEKHKLNRQIYMKMRPFINTEISIFS